MKVEVGDIYVRNSTKKLWKVKRIDNIMVVLESAQDGSRLSLTDIFSLEKAYTKLKSQPS